MTTNFKNNHKNAHLESYFVLHALPMSNIVITVFINSCWTYILGLYKHMRLEGQD